MRGETTAVRGLVKVLSPECVFNHCLIHRFALANKNLPPELKDIIEVCVTTVNHIKKSPLNSRISKQICQDLDEAHVILIWYMEVRWLSKGNMIKRLHELRNSIISFLQNDNDKLNLVTKFLNDEFNQSLAYMVDIFEMINIINVKLQGQDSNLVSLCDQINSFSIKINNFFHSLR